MTTSHLWIHDVTRIHPGELIEVWDQDRLRHAGTVSQTAPHLGVLWILEDATGLPKLIPAQDYRLRHIPGTRAA
ncbi:hypothetical protein ACT4S5_01630 [Kocuria oceani]|uniref:hypothetical protein n=1 Tax=Kocuria oceani TaxID=988827 RepID=UPI00403571F5